MTRRQFLNDPDDFVREALEGLVLAHPRGELHTDPTYLLRTSRGAPAGVRRRQRARTTALGVSWAPGCSTPRCLERCSELGVGIHGDLAAAARAARTGAASTEGLRARRGRSSYLGDVAVGVLDPGAVTVALFFESARR